MSGQPFAQLLWTDFPEAEQAAFHEWYNREHIADRVLRVPGFLQARRFGALQGSPAFATLYEVAERGVFDHPLYQAMRQQPDPTSSRFIPLFANTLRVMGTALVDAGVAEGPAMLLAGFDARPDADPRAWAAQRLPRLVAEPGMLRARLYRTDDALAEERLRLTRDTVRDRLRPPDRYPAWALVVEAMADAPIAAAAAALRPEVEAMSREIVGWAVGRQLFRLAPPRV